MSYQEIARADCTFWNGFRPCDKQRLQGLPNCIGCSLYQKGEETLNLSNREYCPDMLKTASKVGIIEARGLGDILRTTTISKRIREINPNTEIYWFTHTRGVSLLRSIPEVKAIDTEKREHDYIDPKMDVLINFDVSQIAKEIVVKNDCIAGLEVNNRGNFVGVSPYAEYLQRFQIDDSFRSKNTLHRQQIILESIGLEYRGIDYDINLKSENFTVAQRVVDEAFRGQKFRQLIGLNLGSSKKGMLKRWSPDRYVEVAKELARLYPETGILILSGPEDSDAKDSAIEVSGGKEIASNVSLLPNDIEIGNFMAIMAGCTIIVTSDTFAFHAAEALKVPTISLIGPMPIEELEASPSSISIGPKLECSPCFYKCIQPVSGQCMINIEVAEVLKTINLLLSELS